MIYDMEPLKIKIADFSHMQGRRRIWHWWAEDRFSYAAGLDVDLSDLPEDQRAIEGTRLRNAALRYATSIECYLVSSLRKPYDLLTLRFHDW
jgi:hypothetical protein